MNHCPVFIKKFFTLAKTDTLRTDIYCFYKNAVQRIAGNAGDYERNGKHAEHDSCAQKEKFVIYESIDFSVVNFIFRFACSSCFFEEISS